MPDDRVRVTTTKKIGLAQLDSELGGHGLVASEGAAEDGVEADVVAVEGSPVTRQELSDAIAAHVAPDPPPTLADRLAEVEERLDAAPSAADLDELKARLGGTK